MAENAGPGMWEEPQEYFAYAMNLDGVLMRERCPGAGSRRAARLADWRLVFDKATNDWDGSAAANVEPAAGSVVEGALYTLSRIELMRLDAYEGHPRHYSRRLLAVEEADGTRVAAWVYIATPAYRQRGLRPRRDHLERILAGADVLSDPYRERLHALPVIGDPDAMPA